MFPVSVSIEASSKLVKFSSRGDIGSGNIVLKPKSTGDENDRVEIECEESVQLSFAVRYLNYFAKASPLANQVQLRLSAKQPLEVTFNLSDDASQGYLRFYLAPKMDDEECTQSQNDE